MTKELINNELNSELLEEEKILEAETEDMEFEDETEESYSDHLEYDASKSSISTAFDAYVHDITKYPVLTAEEETVLFKKLKELPDGEEKQQIKDEIYTKNLRLVISVAKRYFSCCKSMTPLDVVMEGNLGLMQAVNKFDVDLGNKFSTYATWWIKQAVLRSISNKDDLIRLPVHIKDKDFKIKKEIAELVKNGEAIPEKYSDYALRQQMLSQLSLDKPLNLDGAADEETSLQNIIADENTNIEQYAVNTALRDEILDILNSKECGTDNDRFSEREKEVIFRRFGFNGETPETLEAVASTYGITRERIRQIEVKAIKKFRLPQNKARLRDFLET